MKLPHTIYVLATCWFVFLFITPIIMDWNRPLSPKLAFHKNLEFSTSWDPVPIMNTYKVVIQYCDDFKPNDTIITEYSHYPNEADIICSGWLNWGSWSFYAPENENAIEYLMVCDIEVIQWWTNITDPEEWERLKQKGLVNI